MYNVLSEKGWDGSQYTYRLFDRVNKCLENLNKASSLPYKIEFSMGYAVYDYQLNKNAEEFLRQVDMMMYHSKDANKKIIDIWY